MKLNYKTDFEAKVKFVDCRGEDIGIPSCPWRLKFWTALKANAYEAAYDGEEYTNARVEGDEVVIVFDNHKLSPGKLRMEVSVELANEEYPDGSQRVVDVKGVDIELVNESVPCPSLVDLQVTIPVLFQHQEEINQRLDGVDESIEGLNDEVERLKDADTKLSTDIVKEIQERTEEDARLSNEIANVSKGANESDLALKGEIDNIANDVAQLRQDTTERLNELVGDAPEALDTLKEISDALGNDANLAATLTSEIAKKADASDVAKLGESLDNLDAYLDNELEERLSKYERNLSEYEDKTDSLSSDFDNVKENLEAKLAAKQNVLTVSDDLTLSEDSHLAISDEGKMQAFILLWNSACVVRGVRYGGYYPEQNAEKPFLLNDIWMDLEEATYCYNISGDENANSPRQKFYRDSKIKTIFPLRFGTGVNQDWSDMFFMCTNLEVLQVSTNYCTPGYFNTVFAECSKLREIRGVIQSVYMNKLYCSSPFRYCIALEEVRLGFGMDIDLHWSPKLSYTSLEFAINNRLQTIAFTITLHPNVYAKITDETNAEYEQWHPLLELAQSKNISLATV